MCIEKKEKKIKELPLSLEKRREGNRGAPVRETGEPLFPKKKKKEKKKKEGKMKGGLMHEMSG